MKALKFILALTSLLFLTSCASLGAYNGTEQSFFKNKDVYESVVQVKNDLSFEICDLTEKGQINSCKNRVVDFSVGSGFALSFNRHFSNNIATAGHICKLSDSAKARIQIRAMMQGKFIRNLSITGLEIVSDDGKKYDAYKRKSENSDVDACFLSVGRSFPALQMAKRAPKRSKKYFTLGYPLGIKGENLTIQQSGLYSGYKKGWDFYSIATAPGSSGSPILNQEGGVVGIVSRGPRRFKEVTMSTDFEKLHYFYSKAFGIIN